jgi:hypothetical protein
MKKEIMKAGALLVCAVLTGCASPRMARTEQPARTAAMDSQSESESEPTYQHVNDVEYADGATVFLKLVPVNDP